ncbi:tripartite tricarboxylate transporter substrate-binding protein [Salipiger sp.]|uniref:tripartite tricarboxylate transporter substrate-binding protein n=1 Tax=Salipiger sp. TaxID=2078585 RepID=UPI003A9863B3
MTRFNRRTFTSLALASTMGLPRIAMAETAEDFYTGKQIDFIVSAPAGTLTDFVARQFADFFPRHMAGAPDVVVLNVAGAGGMVAAAQIQHKEAKDGTAVGFLQRNNLYRSLLEGKDAFDPREVQWLGSLEEIAYAIVARKESGFETADQLFEKPLVLGATGFANENRSLPAIANEYLGTKFDIIYGYNGRGEVYLAMERGEVGGWASTIAGLTQGDAAQMLADGDMKVLLHLSRKRHPDFPDVPCFADYDYAAGLDPLMDFMTLPFEAGRPVAVPKEVPAERVAALRAAFAATAADPDFLAAMKAADYPVGVITGERIEEILTSLYATPPEVLDKVRSYIEAPA